MYTLGTLYNFRINSSFQNPHGINYISDREYLKALALSAEIIVSFVGIVYLPIRGSQQGNAQSLL